MSLLLEALKKAELAKQNRAQQDPNETTLPLKGPVDLPTGDAATLAPLDIPVVRDELSLSLDAPSTAGNVTDLGKPIDPGKRASSPLGTVEPLDLKVDQTIPPTSPSALAAGKVDSRGGGSAGSRAVGSRNETAAAAGKPWVADERDRDTARRVFEAKQLDYNPRRPFFITLAAVGLAGVGAAGYLAWEWNQSTRSNFAVAPRPPATSAPTAPQATSTAAPLPPTTSPVTEPATPPTQASPLPAQMPPLAAQTPPVPAQSIAAAPVPPAGPVGSGATAPAAPGLAAVPPSAPPGAPAGTIAPLAAPTSGAPLIAVPELKPAARPAAPPAATAASRPGLPAAATTISTPRPVAAAPQPRALESRTAEPGIANPTPTPTITAAPSRLPATPPAAARPAADTPPGSAVALTRSPRQLDASVERGYEAFLRGDLETARRQYLSALQNDPTNRDAQLGLAAIDLASGNPEGADLRYQRLLEIDPRDTAAQAGLFGLRGQLDPVQSESRLKNLIAQQPDSAPLHFALGNQYAAQNRWTEAQQSYFRAHSAEPDNADYAFNLAVSLDRIRQPKLALDYYQRALALGQGRPAAFDRRVVTARIQELQR